MGWLSETFDGTIMKLMPLAGRDVSPLRPGEPLPGTAGHSSMLTMLDDAQRLGSHTKGLHPRLDRPDMLRLLDEMDSTDLPASVLDMQAEDAVAYDMDKGGALGIEGGNEAIRNEIRLMFHNLKIESRLFGFTRNMALYGSLFERIVWSSTKGVTGLIATNIRDMEIVTDPDTREVRGYKERGRLFKGKTDPVSNPFDYLHFKLTGKAFEEPYGQSVLAAGIRPWTQLLLSEDKALMYRITRQPDRLFFKVDVGQASEAEAFRTLQNYRKSMRKTTNVDPALQKLYSDYNPVGAMEDIWMAIRPNSASDVQQLQGSSNVQDVTDLGYYGRKFLTSTRTPPPMFGFDDPAGQGENYLRNKKLANQDIRYARHILRIQRAICEALHYLAIVHLRLRAVNVESPLLDYDGDPETGKGALRITLPPPSFLAELERLELVQLRGQIATELLALTGTSDAIVVYEWTLWVFKNVLKMSEEVIHKVVQEPPPPQIDAMGQVQPGGPAGQKAAVSAPPEILQRQVQAAKTAGMPNQPSKKTQNASFAFPAGERERLNDASMFALTNGGDLSEREQEQLVKVVAGNPALHARLTRLKEIRELQC